MGDKSATARSASPAMCDEPVTKTMAEWGRELLIAERRVKDRILADLRSRTPCEPTNDCIGRFCTSCIERRIWLRAAEVVADA